MQLTHIASYTPQTKPSLALALLTVTNGVFFSDGFMSKIYLSSSSGIPKYLTCIVTIAMFDELKLTSMKKTQKVMVAEVVYLLGAYARNPAR